MISIHERHSPQRNVLCKLRCRVMYVKCYWDKNNSSNAVGVCLGVLQDSPCAVWWRNVNQSTRVGQALWNSGNTSHDWCVMSAWISCVLSMLDSVRLRALLFTVNGVHAYLCLSAQPDLFSAPRSTCSSPVISNCHLSSRQNSLIAVFDLHHLGFEILTHFITLIIIVWISPCMLISFIRTTNTVTHLLFHSRLKHTSSTNPAHHRLLVPNRLPL